MKSAHRRKHSQSISDWAFSSKWMIFFSFFLFPPLTHSPSLFLLPLQFLYWCDSSVLVFCAIADAACQRRNDIVWRHNCDINSDALLCLMYSGFSFSFHLSPFRHKFPYHVSEPFHTKKAPFEGKTLFFSESIDEKNIRKEAKGKSF